MAPAEDNLVEDLGDEDAEDAEPDFDDLDDEEVEEGFGDMGVDLEVDENLDEETDEEDAEDAEDAEAAEQTAEALEELEEEELELLDDEAAEVLLVDEAAELRAIRRAELTLDTDAEEIRRDEFVCSSCFLVKRISQLADRRKLICRDCAS